MLIIQLCNATSNHITRGRAGRLGRQPRRRNLLLIAVQKRRNKGEILLARRRLRFGQPIHRDVQVSLGPCIRRDRNEEVNLLNGQLCRIQRTARQGRGRRRPDATQGKDQNERGCARRSDRTSRRRQQPHQAMAPGHPPAVVQDVRRETRSGPGAELRRRDRPRRTANPCSGPDRRLDCRSEVAVLR